MSALNILLGQPATVYSLEDDLPTSIHVDMPIIKETSARGQPKYKLALMPSGIEEFSHVCGKAIGQDHSLCSASDYTMSLQGNGISTLEWGQGNYLS